MSKVNLSIFFIVVLLTAGQAFSKPPHPSHYYSPHHNYNHSYNNSSYLVKTEIVRDEMKFVDCNEHSFIKETSIYYYSNGNKKSYSSYTILNSGGGVIDADCSDVKHTIFNGNHYIIIKKGKNYKVVDAKGGVITNKNYTLLSEVFPNRLLAKFDKKYGIIDLNGNVIVPLKYKTFKISIGNLFITNLNGYYGIQDVENNILVKNEFDNIKELGEVFILKKEGKYGLAGINGKIILDPVHDKIKNLGEYILVKKDKKYGVLSSSGSPISTLSYKKIKLKRNTIFAKTIDNKWININTEF